MEVGALYSCGFSFGHLETSFGVDRQVHVSNGDARYGLVFYVEVSSSTPTA